MTALPRRLLWSAAAALLVLMCINAWFFSPDYGKMLSETSFGVTRDGYKAAFDLLTELRLPVTRSFQRVKHVPTTRPLWLVSPSFLAKVNKDEAGAMAPIKNHADDDARDLLDWVRSGGTAVVFGDSGSDWMRLEIDRQTFSGPEKNTVDGDLVRAPRSVDSDKLIHFDSGRDQTKVRLRAGGKPFALELALGKGRLIAIADGGFLRNSALDDADNSVLLFDLARALGPPDFDERYHGMVASASLFATIAGSRAIFPLVIALIAAAVWMAQQRSWPRRTLADTAEGPEPSLVSFVESLGVVYSRANEPAAAFRAYRTGYLKRLRRQFSLRPDVCEDVLLERLAQDRELSDETRQWLIDGFVPSNNRELLTAVHAIESYERAPHE